MWPSFRGGRSLLLAGGTTPRIWRLDPPSEPEALAGHTAEAWSAAFSPDGAVLATGSDDTRETQTIRLWDPASGRLVAGWKAHTATVSSLAFSPDGTMLASGSLDSGKPGNPNVILWDVDDSSTTGEPRGTHRSGSFGRLQPRRPLAGDGQRRPDRTDLGPVSKTTRAVLTGHDRNLNRVAFSPDGRTLATRIQRRDGPALGRRQGPALWNAPGRGEHPGGRVRARRLDDWPRSTRMGSSSSGTVRAGRAGPDHPPASRTTPLPGVHARRAGSRRGGQGEGHPGLGYRHRPGVARSGRPQGPGQRSGVLSRWIDPCLVQSRRCRQAVAHQIDPTRSRNGATNQSGSATESLA